MNTFTRNEYGGLFAYRISGINKILVVSALTLLISRITAEVLSSDSVLDFEPKSDYQFYLYLIGVVWCLFLCGRKIEVNFIIDKNYVERAYKVFGVKFTRKFSLDKITLVSSTHVGKYDREYNKLYLVECCGKKYFIGRSREYEAESVEIAAAEVSRHCKVDYRHGF